jgi:N-acetylmuramoyl-L-alanine amidase
LNASPSPEDRGGVSTFVLDATHDAQALGLAARENEAAEADVSELQPLFASLVRHEQVAKSLDLAHVVHQATLKAGRRKLPGLVDRGVKRALFYVLVGARMPAILCEASFLTRPEEAAALRTDHYRQLLAEGIAEGIARYVREVERARIVPTASARE